jgi:hypothetical protein
VILVICFLILAIQRWRSTQTTTRTRSTNTDDEIAALEEGRAGGQKTQAVEQTQPLKSSSSSAMNYGTMAENTPADPASQDRTAESRDEVEA